MAPRPQYVKAIIISIWVLGQQIQERPRRNSNAPESERTYGGVLLLPTRPVLFGAMSCLKTQRDARSLSAHTGKRLKAGASTSEHQIYLNFDLNVCATDTRPPEQVEATRAARTFPKEPKKSESARFCARFDLFCSPTAISDTKMLRVIILMLHKRRRSERENLSVWGSYQIDCSPFRPA